MAGNMLNLKVGSNLVMFGFCCKSMFTLWVIWVIFVILVVAAIQDG